LVVDDSSDPPAYPFVHTLALAVAAKDLLDVVDAPRHRGATGL
jgi:hypothetical protein